MAAEEPIEKTAAHDTPQLPSLSTAEDGTAALSDSEDVTTQDDQCAITPEVTILSLQRDLQALQSKISRIETEAGLEVDSDTDDEILEFDEKIKETPLGYPVGDAYEKMLQNWRARRKVAKDIIRKSNRLRKLKAQGRLKPRHLNDPDFSDDESKDKPKDPMEGAHEILPVLHSCKWADFVAGRRVVSMKPAIDVLIGKPLVSWRRGQNYTAPDEQMDGAPVEDLSAKGVQGGMLPDRIRVHSRLLLLMFANLHQVSLFGMFANEEAAVFLRPFKMLVFFEDQIRDQYAKLIARHGEEGHGDVQISSVVVQEARPSTPINDPSVHSVQGDASNSADTISPDADLEANSEAKESAALGSKLMLEHMRPLIQFLDEYISPRQTYLQSQFCDKITFQDLWLIFKPGAEVIASGGNQAYRVVRIQTRRHRAIPPWKGFEKREASQSDELPSEPFADDGDDKPFTLWCVCIDSDGISLGPVTKEIEVRSFEGEKHIIDLPVYPLRLRTKSIIDPVGLNAYTGADQISVREELIERGKQFVGMSTIKHAHYSGQKYGTRETLDGQVVIDNSLVFQQDETQTPPDLSSWVRGSGNTIPFDGRSIVCVASCCVDDRVHLDQSFDDRRNAEYLEEAFPTITNGIPSLAVLERQISEVQEDSKAGKISNADYVIMSDRVHGFVLQTREWVELDLRFISPVQYSRERAVSAARSQDKNVTNTAFDDLVLPPGHKEVILSLVAQHYRGDGRHEVDIIKGKGKGLIVLLHGAPGVGKTSTAEGVAEAFKKPLLQITSGDLGLTAEKVGKSLQRNFDLASRWGCVLLLDEADVFLASRTSAESSADLNRNALVAVFLRVLEYYTGILFLTTNRIGDFDEAFASRIHLSLEYPQLDKRSTESILALNMGLIKKRFDESGRKIDIEETKICSKFTSFWDENESSRLNGRQIRNACQTALALAEFEAQGSSHIFVLKPEATVRLQSSHFDTILDAYLDFAVYLNNTYGIPPDQRAKEQKLRAKHRSEKKARDRATHAHTGSAGPHTGGFSGAHLYNQPTAQHFAPGQFSFQSADPGVSGYGMPPQYQRPFQNQIPTHPGLQNMQYAGPNASLSDLLTQNAQRQANTLNAHRHAETLNSQRMPNEMEDTHAGHGSHYQGQPANLGLASQYPQSQ